MKLLWTLLLSSTAFAASFPFQQEGVHWDPEEAPVVHFSPGEDPQLWVKGKVDPGLEMEGNGKTIPVKNSQFFVGLQLPKGSNAFRFKFKKDSVDAGDHRVVYEWKKLPAAVTEGKEQPAEDWLASRKQEPGEKEREGSILLPPEKAATPAATPPTISTGNRPPERTLLAPRSLSDLAYRLQQIEVFAVAVSDQTGGFVVSGGFGWVPQVRLYPSWVLKGGLDFSLLKNRSSYLLATTEYRLGIAHSLTADFQVEVRGGGQTWFGYNPFLAFAGVQVALASKSFLNEIPLLDLADQVFFSYSFLFSANNPQIFKLGVRVPF